MAAGAPEEHEVDVSKLKLVDIEFTGAVQAGEENEEVLWTDSCRLYRMHDGQLKNRGRGEAKIVQGEGRPARFILREKDVGKVRANHYLTGDIVLTQHAAMETVMLWACMDFAEGELESETLAIRFKTKEETEAFAAAFRAAVAAAPEVTAAAAAGGGAAAGPAGPAGEPVPVVETLEAVYGDESQQSRYEQLVARFTERFEEEPSFFVRAPGRVNIIGEHIDYHNFDVLPFALAQDVVIAVAVGAAGEGEVQVANTSADYADASFPAERGAKPDLDGGLQWWHYVQAAYGGAFAEDKAGSVAALPLKLLVDGTVPPAAGLSSSSALTVASTLATLQAHGINSAKAALGSRAHQSEFAVGTAGGAMDQMISACAQRGAAAVVSFKSAQPTVTPMPLPADARFVVANSLVAAPKAASPAEGYNLRVYEGKLAAKLVAKKAGVADWLAVSTLSDLQRALGKATPGEVVEAVEEHLSAEPYTGEMLFGEDGFGMSPDSVLEKEAEAQREALSATGSAVLATGATLSLQARARHVLTEAARQAQFAALCAGGSATLAELGELLNGSQASLAGDYACSCTELDQLCTIARENGATGARLTGAGWGGCVVALCSEATVEGVVGALRAQFYAGKEAEAETAVFVTAPCAGAAVYLSEDMAEV